MTPNVLLVMALQFISEYRKARARQQALDPRTTLPDDPATPEREDFLTDEQLFALLNTESGELEANADALIAKYRALL